MKRIPLLAISLIFFTHVSLSEESRPNILLLVAEDLSARVGVFGDDLAHTPKVDMLAAEGVRYTNMFTTAGVCAPSRAALITGQHQISFGAQHMRSTTGPLGKYFAQPAPDLRAFPELMREKGYFTYTDKKLDYQFSGGGAGTGPFTIWDREAAAATAWREREDGQPFFGMINFMATHESGIMRLDVFPHGMPHFKSQLLRLTMDLIAPTVTDPSQVKLPPYYPDLPEVRSDIARHYDNIRLMDKQVGEILAALESDGLGSNTIVIWTTDHGDGLPRAKRELYDSGIHVPMIVYVPPALRERYGIGEVAGVDDQLLSFVDLAPTLLSLAGITSPAYGHGRNFINTDAEQRQSVIASRDRVGEVMDRQRAIRTQQFKYIRSHYPEVPGGHLLNYRDSLEMVRAWREAYEAGELTTQQRRWFEPAGEEQLYDVLADPHEMNNLAGLPEYAPVLADLRNRLDQRLREIGDMGDMPEATMRAQFLDADDEIPTTPPPEVELVDGLIYASSKMNASIGYRLEGEEHWQLYTDPLPINDLELKSVRYGWTASKVVRVAAE